MGEVKVDGTVGYWGEWLRLAAVRDYNGEKITFYGRIREPNGSAYRLVDMTFDEIEDRQSAVFYPPAFVLTEDHARMLMDDLWNCGIRPSDMGDSVGALEATTKHLEDMQTIVFDYVFPTIGRVDDDE